MGFSPHRAAQKDLTTKRFSFTSMDQHSLVQAYQKASGLKELESNTASSLPIRCNSESGQLHLPEAHLSLLCLTAPSDQVNEGKKLLCPCSSQHPSVKLLLSTPCAYSVYGAQAIHPVPSHLAPSNPILPHLILSEPVPTASCYATLQQERKQKYFATQQIIFSAS